MQPIDTSSPLCLVLIGQVDHGKSTLIGRLLQEGGALADGRLEAVKASCQRRGMRFEWAFLLDALQIERDQGITIDTTQIRLKTGMREIVLIDAPGHQEFLGNMVTGAQQADAALLVIDALEGIGAQTLRHASLLPLLGVRQLVVVVNKMDAVAYQEAPFRHIEQEIIASLAHLGLRALHILPVSAREGEGISVHRLMPWHHGPALLAVLDGFAGAPPPDHLPLRFPIQDIYKFDDRRILAGRIESGTLRVGDRLLFSPGNAQATVAGIVAWPEHPAPEQATAGQSVGIILTEPLFIERGEMASHVDDAPCLTHRLRARLFWLGQTPLAAGRRYTLRLATRELGVEITAIHRAEQVERGQLADVELRARGLLAVDDGAHLPRTGRFVLVEGTDIVGGGVAALDGIADRRVKSQHIAWVDQGVTALERARAHGHLGGILWFTGLSGAGKSTLAVALQRRLFNKGYQVFVLDGDNIRHGLSRDLGFSPSERHEHIRRVAEVAALFAQSGMIAIAAFISPMREDRRMARAIAPDAFHEIHINASLEACERRDAKGLYKKARAGEIAEFTGISAPYEAPERPDMVVDTQSGSIEECVAQLLAYIERQLVAPLQQPGGASSRR